jgi:hypothetical protein
MTLKRRDLLFCAAILFSFAFSSFILGEEIKERFGNNEKLSYKVLFNRIPVGKIEWVYLGREKIEGKLVDIISVSSNTKIFEFLNLTSEEKVFLDFKTHLPVKVERNIIFFGKKEKIEEFYNQEEGYVKIVKNHFNPQENIFYQDAPIHNILSLLYFFPKDIDLKIGDLLIFNLPTQKLKIKVLSSKILYRKGEKRDTYFLLGRGKRKFKLFLDKEDRIPLRLDFLLLIGKITILKQE